MATSVYHIQSKLDQERYSETEVESIMLKALLSDQLLLFQLLVAYESVFL